MLNNIKQIGWVLALIFCISDNQGYGQTVSNSYGEIRVEITKAKKPKSINAKVEITHAFPGGDTAWIHALEKRLERDLPFRNGARKGRYVVNVAFIVLKDGSVAEVRCISDPGYGMGETVVRAIQKGPRWTPAPPGHHTSYTVRRTSYPAHRKPYTAYGFYELQVNLKPACRQAGRKSKF